MRKKNKAVAIKDTNCLNCGYPFTHDEKFCPECGQKNKGQRITFNHFIKEVFAGFFSWDTKFWKTIVPLLFSPGKVSKDYTEGKRARYTNPFRFYLMVSILFFLFLGAINTYQSFMELKNEETSNNVNFTINPKQLTAQQLDSVNNIIKEELNNSLKNVDTITKKQLEKLVPNLDSIATKKTEANVINFNLGLPYSKLKNFQRNNPLTPAHIALDSLKIKKTFFNKFMYAKMGTINSWESNTSIFLKQLISYASISIFILLPIFTLFIKLIYLRRRYTYIEHLVFVFHTQTVFFILLTLFTFIYTVNKTNTFLVFSIAFLVYLFLAMKRFYQQSYLKTFIKYILVNFVFIILASLGIAIVSFVTFLLS